MHHRFYLLLAVLWAGSLWTIGYIAAPTLFALLDDRQLAGMIAGRLFYIEAIISLTCGTLLLGLSNVLIKRGEYRYRRLRWLVLGMLLCTAIGYFALQPAMNALREQARLLGQAGMTSPYGSRFGMLHGISSGFYLLQSLFGLWLIWRLSAPLQDQAAPRS